MDIDKLIAAGEITAEVARGGMKLIKNLLGESFKAAGDLAADQVRFWQWKNRLRIATLAKKRMESEGIAVRVVPPGFLLPLLEAVGNVEEPELQELWSRLLASAVADRDSQHPMFVQTLKRMNAVDAVALKEIAAHALPSEDQAIKPDYLLALDGKALDRLANLGLLSYGYLNQDDSSLKYHMFTTPFALQFCEALGIGPKVDDRIDVVASVDNPTPQTGGH